MIFRAYIEHSLDKPANLMVEIDERKGLPRHLTPHGRIIALLILRRAIDKELRK